MIAGPPCPVLREDHELGRSANRRRRAGRRHLCRRRRTPARRRDHGGTPPGAHRARARRQAIRGDRWRAQTDRAMRGGARACPGNGESCRRDRTGRRAFCRLDRPVSDRRHQRGRRRNPVAAREPAVDRKPGPLRPIPDLQRERDVLALAGGPRHSPAQAGQGRLHHHQAWRVQAVSV